MESEKGSCANNYPCRTVKKTVTRIQIYNPSYQVKSGDGLFFVIIFEDFIAQTNYSNSETTKA